MTIEDQLAEVRQQNALILAELRELRAERQHQGGHWGSRAEACGHLGIGLDAVDAMIARGELRAERIGSPPVERRDRLGRRIDRRRVRVWIAGAPKTAAEIADLAEKARAE